MSFPHINQTIPFFKKVSILRKLQMKNAILEEAFLYSSPQKRTPKVLLTTAQV